MVTCAMELSDHVIGVVKKDGTQKVDGIYVSTLVLISVWTEIVKELEESVNLVVKKGFMVLIAWNLARVSVWIEPVS